MTLTILSPAPACRSTTSETQVGYHASARLGRRGAARRIGQGVSRTDVVVKPSAPHVAGATRSPLRLREDDCGTVTANASKADDAACPGCNARGGSQRVHGSTRQENLAPASSSSRTFSLDRRRDSAIGGKRAASALG